jgi:hypothetical protein
MLTWKVGAARGVMLAHGQILMRKYYAIFGMVRGNILPLEALYRVVLEQILFLNVSITLLHTTDV